MNQLSVAIIGGVIVYVASQYIQRFILEPLIEYKKTTAEISHIILLNQAKILNGGPDEQKLKDDLHTLSARLRPFTKLIPFYEVLRKVKIFGLPTKDDILSASHCLNIIGYAVIDNGMPKEKSIFQSAKAVNELSVLLDIETTYTSPVDGPNNKMKAED